MKTLTPAGEKFADDLASQYSLSRDSAERMIAAVRQGNGSMAQFSCPELGSGQWMRGGMTMVSDMFNNRLKATVNDICSEIANALDRKDLFKEGEPTGTPGSSEWWPAGLGSPSSAGAQNRSRYAVFPATRRLAIEREGKVTLYDTGDHRIGGVGQQQGGGDSISFSSQHGTVPLSSLTVISGAGEKAAAKPEAAKPEAPKTSGDTADIPGLLEKLGKLRDAGVLSEEEFKAKKAELLARL